MRGLPLLVLVCCLSIPMLASAEGWPELTSPPGVAAMGKDDVAVLVGIEDYVFVPPVRGARENVAEWEVFLRQGLGVTRVTTLVNEQATREEVLAAAEAAAELASPESTVWFLFIGHGAPAMEGGDGLLLGVDAQQTERSVAARGIEREALLDRLQRGRQHRTVVLLDACFSGRTADGEALVPNLQPLVPVSDNPPLAEATVLLTAAQSNEFAGSMPGFDRPAFSYLVLGGLRGWADGGDGRVTADEAVVFARQELLSIPGRRQTPTVAGLTNTVLSEDAHEVRPAAGPALVADDDSTSTKIEARRTTDGHPVVSERARLFTSLGVGAGAELTYETGALVLDALLGLRLNAPSQLTRFNLVGGVTYANVTNAYSREAIRGVNEVLAGADAGVQLNIDHGQTSHMLFVGTGPGLEIGRGAMRFFGEFRGGLALPLGGECREWSFDESGRSTECLDRRTDVSGAGGARMGVAFKFVELAGHATFMPRKVLVPATDSSGSVVEEERSTTLLVAGLTLGVTFDL